MPNYRERRHPHALSVFIVVALLSDVTRGYPYGAPESACTSLLPDHGRFRTQTSTSSYNITTNCLTYDAGQPIAVTLSGRSFKGFIIKGRVRRSNNTSGTFSAPSSDLSIICSSAAVTQKTAKDRTSVTVVWTAPPSAAGGVLGDVFFVATVVQSYEVFWTSVSSAYLTYAEVTTSTTTTVSTSTASTVTSSAAATTSTLTAPSPSTTTGTATTTTTTTTKSPPHVSSTTTSSSTTASTSLSPTASIKYSDVDVSTCGTVKACFRSRCPAASGGSGGGSCEYVLTWKDEGADVISFEMSAAVSSARSWTAFGLSHDRMMGDDSVISCVYNDVMNQVDVEVSWNNEQSNEPLTDTHLGLVQGRWSGGIVDGRIVCRFQRLKLVPKQQRRRSARQTNSFVYSLDGGTNYFIIMASGPMAGATKAFHTNTISSNEAVNFTVTGLNILDSDSNETNLQPASPISGEVDASACGATKSCLRYRCSGDGLPCDYLLTWADTRQGAISFEMSGSVAAGGSTKSYVAFGLSRDDKMGDDSVVSCIFNDVTSTVDVEVSWNTDSNTPLTNGPGLAPGSLYAGVINNRIVCRFQRFITVTPPNDKIFPLDGNASYYILMAKGPASKGIKRMHTERIASAEAVDFGIIQNIGARENTLKTRLVKAHSILMLFAWTIFASFGMLMARYYKPNWSEHKWFGKAIWFQIHQMCMVATLLLTATAFIIIFCAVKRYSNLSSAGVAHAPLGIIVMILVIINPVMALFRPEPNTKFRPAFNVVHFLVGFLAQLTSVVVIFLGLYYSYVAYALPLWCLAVMAAMVGFHIIIELILLIHKLVWPSIVVAHIGTTPTDSSAETTTAENDKIQKFVVNEDTSKTPTTNNSFKTLMLFLHWSGVVGCSVAIAVQIGIN